MAETPSKTFYDNSEIKSGAKARARGTAKKEENQMKRLFDHAAFGSPSHFSFRRLRRRGKESSATSGETAGGSSSNQASTEETDWSSQEPYTVKLLIPGDAKTEDVEEVSAAASKILEEKYNTTLEIMRVGFGSYPDQVNLMLSSGEKLDVLYNNRDIFVSAINNGQIISMEEYLPEYGPDLLEQIPERDGPPPP